MQSISRPAAVLFVFAAACAADSSITPGPTWPLRPDSLEHNGWDRDCDLLHLTLDLTIDYEGRRVHGTATNWIRALADGTDEIRLHAIGLSIRAVVDSRGRDLEFERRDPWLTIQLAEPMARDEEESLRIAYVCKPQSGMYFVESSKDHDGFAPQVWTQGQEEENRHWFPSWDYPNDRATYDASIRVGYDMTAVSNGELIETTVHGHGERTFHWRLQRPIPTYLIAIAAGRWERYTDEWNDIPIEYYVAPGTGEEKARRAFGETPAMMAFFSELLDEPYPYPKYAQAAVAEHPSGGMENASITIINDYVIGDEGEIEDLDGDPRLLVAHELAHHWFGDLVTCLGWSHLWLNEAWASYLELLYQGHVADPGSFKLWLERYREWYMVRGTEANVPVSLDWRTQGSGARSNHVYDKGPWILYMIQREVGDEPFWRAVRTYLDRHAHGLVTAHDFVRAIFDETGRNVEWMIEQWVEGGGYPIFEVTYRERDVPGVGLSVGVRVTQAQELDELVPLFNVPVDVDLYLADGRVTRHRIHVRHEEELFVFDSGSRLVDIVFDGDAALLCDARVEKPVEMWAHQALLFDRPAVQWRALDHLHELAPESEEARLALLRVLVESPQPLLRQRAARYADFQDPRSQHLLVMAATKDPEARVRREAAHTLLQHTARDQFLPHGEEYEAFLDRLQVESSPAVRAKITELLDLGS